MFSIGPFELLILLVLVVVAVVLLAYWVIRRGTRDGVKDAQRDGRAKPH